MIKNMLLALVLIPQIAYGASDTRTEPEEMLFERGIAYTRRDESSSATVNAMATTTTYVKLASVVSTINGMTAPADSMPKFIVISNMTGGPVTFSDQSASASASDRFDLPGGNDLEVADRSSASFIYDHGESRWVVAGGGGGGGKWGSITGTLSDQNDLKTALDAKAPATTGTGYQKGDGLGGFTNQDAPIPIADGGTNGTTKTAAFDNLSPTSTKGQTIVNDGTNNVALDPCDDDELLVADSSEASGFRCQTANLSLMTEWKDYTLTVGATTTAPTPATAATSHARWRQVGHNMEIEVTLAQANGTGGNSGSGTYLFPIPTGYTIDTSSTGISISTNGNGAGGTVVGHGYGGNTTSFVTASAGPGEVTAHSNTELQLCIYYNTGTNGIGCVGSTLSQFGSASYISFRASVPIVEFAQASTVDIFEAGDYGWTSCGPLTIGATTTAPTKGTVTVDSCYQRKVGDTMEIRYDFEQTAAGSSNGSGIYLLPIPLGKSADTSKIAVSTGGTLSALGSGGISLSSSNPTTSYQPVNAVLYDSTHIAVQTLGYTSSQGGFWSVSNYALGSNANVVVSFTAKIPIDGWSTFPLQIAMTGRNAKLSCNASSSVISGSSWISAVGNRSSESCSFTIKTGTFPAEPVCTATIEGTTVQAMAVNMTSATAGTVYGPSSDYDLNLQCGYSP